MMFGVSVGLSVFDGGLDYFGDDAFSRVMREGASGFGNL